MRHSTHTHTHTVRVSTLAALSLRSFAEPYTIIGASRTLCSPRAWSGGAGLLTRPYAPELV